MLTQHRLLSVRWHIFWLLSNADCTVLLPTENQRRWFGDRNVGPHTPICCRKQKMIKFQQAAGMWSLAARTLYLHTHKELRAHCQVWAPCPLLDHTCHVVSLQLGAYIKGSISHTKKKALIPHCYAPDWSVSTHGLCGRQPHWSTWWPWVCHRGTLIIAL